MTALIQKSKEIWHRDDFSILCEWRKLYRVIEVGVDKGLFANTFLKRCYNCDLYLGVDPYQPYSEMDWNREADFLAAVQIFNQHPRAKLLRTTSAQASDAIKSVTNSLYYSRSFDFVYLDADHSKDSVSQNITDWWDLLSPQGILAGHDWLTKSGDHAGVKEAVIEFATPRNLTIYYTPDDPQSWYLYKSGKPNTEWERC